MKLQRNPKAWLSALPWATCAVFFVLHPPAGLAMGAPGIFPLIVGSVDHRKPQLTGQYPYSAVGILLSPLKDDPNHNEARCTGTLVWHNLVLTAAHCFVDERTGEPFTHTTFTPNRIGDKSPHPIRVTRLELGAYDKDAANIEHDWAILTLETSAVLNGEFMDIKGPADRLSPTDMTAVTYSPDYLDGTTAGVHEGCGIFGFFVTNNRQHYLLTSCDSMPGGSGGPIFTWVPGQRAVIGAVVHAEQEEIRLKTKSRAIAAQNVNGVNFAVDASEAAASLSRARLDNPWPK